MSNPETQDYLWDGAGTPDPELERLERALGRYGLKEPARALPPLEPRGWWQPLVWSRGFRWAAAAGAALLLLCAAPWTIRRLAEPDALCKIYCVAGAPLVDGRPLTASGQMAAGGLVETGTSASAEVRIGLIGHITVFPDSRLRLVEMRRGRYRMALEYGKILARTLAPPFTFVVETPGATAYDLGCSFTLESDARGTGRLHVLTGWVQLELEDRQVLIPGGAICPLRAGGKLGTPSFENASETFRAALARLDFEEEDEASRAATLSTLLAAARPRDAFSLMEMLRTAAGEERHRIVDRTMELVPPPAGITRADLLRGDQEALYAWRKELGLGEVKRWWIHWRDLMPE